jgi:hypothetical protein
MSDILFIEDFAPGKMRFHYTDQQIIALTPAVAAGLDQYGYRYKIPRIIICGRRPRNITNGF